MSTDDLFMYRNRARRLGIPLAMFVLLLVGIVAGATPDREINDANVRDAIEDEIFFDASVPLDDIDVVSVDGIVTLTGTVDNILAKDRAARIARTVKGVRSVVNRIEVEPATPRSDLSIERDVHGSLVSDPAADSYEVDAEVEDGIVTLTGQVDSWQEKKLAENVAKSVKGVKDVANGIVVIYDTDRSDYEIRKDIEETLEWDILVDHALIDVSVTDGVASLSGIVGSAAEELRAINDAWVAGVSSVDASDLEVARWARDEDLRKHKYAVRLDDEIQNAVEDALFVDPRVSSFDITTTVDAGRVTLRGNVDYLKAKRAAEQNARNTVGVVDVTNRIKVRPVQAFDDASIRSEINDALLRDPVVESYEIDVRVRRGEVTLTGEVDSYYEKFRADDVAATVNGVATVNNDLQVDDETTPFSDPYVDPYSYAVPVHPYYRPDLGILTDADIKEDVEDEIWWSPFVDSDDVTVTVEDGVVTLAGTVDSWSELHAAVENAYEGGAVAVDNDLIVLQPSASS